MSRTPEAGMPIDPIPQGHPISQEHPISHEHVFLGADHHRNERRVRWVIILTAAMMAIEIIAGTVYGSMALVADGWHMATHAAAMLIAAMAYAYARRHAGDARFTFGTGKLGDLAGFASAIVLALTALLIGWESALRLVNPVPIDFDQAMGVAVIGLGVNLLCAWWLRDEHSAHHGHSHGHGSSHGPSGGHAQGHGDHAHAHGHAHGHGGADSDDHGHGQTKAGGHDHNLRAAHLHVLADALTSVLAIVALLAGRSYGWTWADPAMGVVGAIVIARWSWGLIRVTAGVLLDAASEGRGLADEIREALADSGDRITDLHVWQVGPGHFAAIVAVASVAPRDSQAYKGMLAHIHELSHVTVETARLPA